MFTGAVAASYYGTPRTTMDVDIIIQATQKDVAKLAAALKHADIHHQETQISAAISSDYRILSLHDAQTPYTVDIILSSEPLEKRVATIADQPTYIQTPEALILAKLRMIKTTVPRERAGRHQSHPQKHTGKP
ncbi:MAG: hypothetical protein ABIJ47_02005 [Candidatus Bathyarchaeota archaeon]